MCQLYIHNHIINIYILQLTRVFHIMNQFKSLAASQGVGDNTLTCHEPTPTKQNGYYIYLFILASSQGSRTHSQLTLHRHPQTRWLLYKLAKSLEAGQGVGTRSLSPTHT